MLENIGINQKKGVPPDAGVGGIKNSGYPMEAVWLAYQNRKGRSCAPFTIYKNLLEYGRSASLRGWVAGTLATWGHRVARQP
jgi:hypothetical protein